MAYGAFGEPKVDSNKLTISYQFQSQQTPHTLPLSFSLIRDVCSTVANSKSQNYLSESELLTVVK